MPKNRGDKNGKNVVRVESGRLLFQYTLDASTGDLVQYFAPQNFGNRLSVVADQYGLYRFTKLDMLFFPTTASNGTDYVAGTMLGTTDTTTSTGISLTNASELPWSIFVPGILTVPQRIVMSRADLMKGPVPWYKAIFSNNVPDWDEVQVTLIASGTASAPVRVMVDYVCEFCDPIASVFTPSPKVSTPVACGRGEQNTTSNRGLVPRGARH